MVFLLLSRLNARIPGEHKFPIVYVVYGPGAVPLARAVVRLADPCPALELSSAAGVNISMPAGFTPTIRGVGTHRMPFAFPVKVCEVELPSELPGRVLAWGGRAVPRISRRPRLAVTLGDTGLRVKASNLGDCEKPSDHWLYGIRLCSHKHRVPFDASLVSGQYQDISDWPLRTLIDEAASEEPDLVIHMGDFLYRQSPCAKNMGCASINNQHHPSRPGNWGDNWNGWYADFFEPSLELLSAAPWIVLRGNHEQCNRGGHGYFLFVDPRPLPVDYTTDYCIKYTEAYSVPFEHEQFLVLDDSAIQNVNFDDKCPAPGSRQSAALPASRYDHPEQTMSREGIDAEIAHFADEFRKLEANALPHVTNILLTHRPLVGVMCHQHKYYAVDWTLQRALGNSTLERISAIFSGHVHWFQGIVYENHALPVQVVMGNGGTKLESQKMDSPRAIEGLTVHGARIQSAFTSKHFGYSRLTRGEDGNYDLHALTMGKSRKLRASPAPHLWKTGIPSGTTLKHGKAKWRDLSFAATVLYS